MPEPAAPEAPVTNPLSSQGLSESISAVRAQIGGGRELTSLTINEVQTQFIVRRGKDVEAWSVMADDGSVIRQDASISITGDATVKDFAFKLDAVDPGAVDRMLARTRKLSGAQDLLPTVLRLERDLSAGPHPPEWTINAEGKGRYLTYAPTPREGRFATSAARASRSLRPRSTPASSTTASRKPEPTPTRSRSASRGSPNDGGRLSYFLQGSPLSPDGGSQ